MMFALILVFVSLAGGGLMIDLLMARRTGARAGLGLIRALAKNPNVKAFLKLANSPEFENFIANAFKTIQLVNEKLPGLLKNAEGFLNPLPPMETLTPDQVRKKEVI